MCIYCERQTWNKQLLPWVSLAISLSFLRNKNLKKKDLEMAQSVNWFPNKHNDMRSDSQHLHTKQSMMVDACCPNSWWNRDRSNIQLFWPQGSVLLQNTFPKINLRNTEQGAWEWFYSLCIYTWIYIYTCTLTYCI